jgi:hypothetical protein
MVIISVRAMCEVLKYAEELSAHTPQQCLTIFLFLFLDIVHRPVYYLKRDVLETVFCPHLQVEPFRLGQSDRT